MMDANEREVYKAAIHGDRDAFEMIIRTHTPRVAAVVGVIWITRRIRRRRS